jgi:hypothetical protein
MIVTVANNHFEDAISGTSISIFEKNRLPFGSVDI